MIPDLKPVNLSLRVSRALLYWVIIVHGLSAVAILLLSLSFDFNLLVTTVLLLVVCLGCLNCYRKGKSLKWSKISFDGNQWALFPANSTIGDEPVLVELVYYYRFGKSWILGFRQLDKNGKRVIIPLLPDMCGSDDYSCNSDSDSYDKDSLIHLSHILLMANN